jgi:exosortase
MFSNAARFLRTVTPRQWAVLLAVGVCVLWAYWTAFGAMAVHWAGDPHYSHGYLVPLFSVALLLLRWPDLQKTSFRPSWWGLGLLAVGVALRLADAFFFVDWFDSLSLLPSLAGLAVLFGGWAALRWSWPAIAFLFFMMPLPYFVETAMAFRLRSIATQGSTYVLQTVGLPAVADGTDIFLSGDTPLRVAPACSGMGMMLTFFALSSAIALVVRRPWTDKLVILLSAPPIAIIANVVRISTTGVLYEVSANETARKVFHGGAGMLMMLVGLLILAAELTILRHLLVPREPARSLRIDFSPGGPSR